MSQDTVGSQGRRQLAMYEPVLYFLLINRDDGLAGFFAPGGTRTHDRTMFVAALRHYATCADLTFTVTVTKPTLFTIYLLYRLR